MSEIPPTNPYAQTPSQMKPADEKLWSTLIHVGGIFFSAIPALLGYLLLKDRGPFVRAHSMTALNFQLTMLIVYIAGSLLSFLILPGIAVVVAAILVVIFSIIAAIASNRGDYYNYPLAIPFFK